MRVFSTTKYEREDYTYLRNWWVESECPVPHQSQLDTLGYIGWLNDVPVCAVWAYKSEGVAVAFLEHLVTNPEVSAPFAKLQAVKLMMDHILADLKNDGYQLIRGVTWSPVLAKICKKHWGFNLIDDKAQNMSLMI